MLIAKVRGIEQACPLLTIASPNLIAPTMSATVAKQSRFQFLVLNVSVLAAQPDWFNGSSATAYAARLVRR